MDPEQFAGVYVYTTDPPSGTGCLTIYQNGDVLSGTIEVFSGPILCGTVPLYGWATAAGAEIYIDLSSTSCDCRATAYVLAAYEDPDVRDVLIGPFWNDCGGAGGFRAERSACDPTATESSTWGTIKSRYTE